MSSCLIDVAQFVYVLGVHMNDSPDVFADEIFGRYPVGICDLVQNLRSIRLAATRVRKIISNKKIFSIGVQQIS